jgi:hypothetical protein
LEEADKQNLVPPGPVAEAAELLAFLHLEELELLEYSAEPEEQQVLRGIL